MGKKIALEAAFSLHQKIMLIGFSSIILKILSELLAINLNVTGYVVLFSFSLLFLFLMALAFSKKSLIKNGEKLFKAKSFLGFTLFKRKVDLSERPIVSILKFRKRQKFSFVSAASPDQSESFNSFEIFVLNDRHTKRESVFYFKKEENAKLAVEFLTNDFPLKLEVFSPNFD